MSKTDELQGRTVHPVIFKINGFNVQVAAYCLMTDEQAFKAACHAMKKDTPPEESKVGDKPFTALTDYTTETLKYL